MPFDQRKGQRKGQGGKPQRGNVNGNNARGGAQQRTPWRDDNSAVRSNLPPGWPSGGSGRR